MTIRAWLAATTIAAFCVLGADACGSSAAPPAGGSLAGASASGGGSAAGGAAATTLHVSGAFTAVAAQDTSQALCQATSDASGPTGQIEVFYDTEGSSGPSNIYEVDMSFIPAGTTTTFPIASKPAGAGPTLRFSYRSDSDYLDWGYAANPAPQQPAGAPAQGTVTMAAGATSGQFSLQLPFTGDDSHTMAAGSKPAVTITGGWTCTS